MVKEKIIYLNN